MNKQQMQDLRDADFAVRRRRDGLVDVIKNRVGRAADGLTPAEAKALESEAYAATSNDRELRVYRLKEKGAQ